MMTSRLTILAATALLGAGAAGAQTAAPADAQGGAGAMQRGPGDITCRDISVMDMATVPGVLYYIAGYEAGRAGEGAGGMTAGTEPAAAEGMTAEADTGTEAEMPATTAPDAGGTAAGLAEGVEESAEAAPGVAPGETEGGDAAAATGGTAGTGAGMDADMAQVVTVQGFFEIPVERTIVACAAAPDAPAREIIEQQRGMGDGMGDTGAAGGTGGAEGTGGTEGTDGTTGTGGTEGAGDAGGTEGTGATGGTEASGGDTDAGSDSSNN